jgi:hypothetical protein
MSHVKFQNVARSKRDLVSCACIGVVRYVLVAAAARGPLILQYYYSISPEVPHPGYPMLLLNLD